MCGVSNPSLRCGARRRRKRKRTRSSCLSSTASTTAAASAVTVVARTWSVHQNFLLFNHGSEASRRSTLSGVVLDKFLVRPLPEGSGIRIWEELGVGRGRQKVGGWGSSLEPCVCQPLAIQDMKQIENDSIKELHDILNSMRSLKDETIKYCKFTIRINI